MLTTRWGYKNMCESMSMHLSANRHAEHLIYLILITDNPVCLQSCGRNVDHVCVKTFLLYRFNVIDWGRVEQNYDAAMSGDIAAIIQA